MNRARRRTNAAAATAVVLATAGGLLTVVAAPASAATSCASPVFKRQFFANTSFSGTAKKTDCDSTINENWGTGAPASGLPKDNFSVRWTVTRDFGSGGPFALSAATQDGIRVYLDGVRKVDLWKNVSTTVTKTVNVTVPSGKHTLRVDFVNWTGKANVKFAYTPRTSATVDKVKPLTPAGTSVKYDAATGKAKLTWAKNKEMDLAGYRVYRRLKGASFSGTPLATTTSTTYTDITLPKTVATYYYEVRAYDMAGNVSAGTADLPVTTADRTPPAAPTKLKAESSSDGVLLAWNMVADASSYRVYRATSSDGTYTRIAATGLNSYVDGSSADDTRYYYRVTAVDAAGNESARSATVSATRWDVTPPSAVTGLTATPTRYGFHLTWDANPTPDLSRYVVYAGELVGDDEEQACIVNEVAWLFADTTSYDYATVPDGEERCLFVDAVDDNGNSHYRQTRSPNIVTANELDTTPSVPTPEDSSVRLYHYADNGVIELNWNRVADATGYQIYRWNPDTRAYEKLAATANTSYSYTDTGAARGDTHYYWVTAQYADGTESAPGGETAVLRP
ncbi:PA14 domain-containing protein [Streptomyces colonosanans]|uniref:Cellulose 1,4-beta-cellobiosidase n=1 Tax=Streptomyces colonosanans TaxID=1428652 RepID=A0A1S2Q7X8_9ACTN|nr:PA14 domain-containing protein [Streptomyces colonosanans]OIK01853.1 cellulose 1,4-beta-cellobiosidase [Streptomyces colonosanans]